MISTRWIPRVRGDNFMAGVIYGMTRGDSIKDCLRLGNLFAGQSTTASAATAPR